MSGTAEQKVDMTREQKEAWLAIEGWSPWQALYHPKAVGHIDGDYGARNGAAYIYVPRSGDGPYSGNDVAPTTLSKEQNIMWDQVPEWALIKIMRRIHESR